MIFAPALIIPPERPAIVRACDLNGLPSYGEMQRRESALREGTFPFPVMLSAPIPLGTPVSLTVGASSTSSTPTFASTGSIQAGALALVFFGGTSAVTATAVSDGVNSYTKAILSGPVGGASTAEIWYCPNAAAVTNPTYAFTLTGSASIQVVPAYISGVLLSSPLDKTNTDGGTPTVAGTTIASGTLSRANEVVFGMYKLNTTDAGFSQASGFTAVNQITSNPVIRVAYAIVAATTTVTYAPTWTSETGTYASTLATFKGN